MGEGGGLMRSLAGLRCPFCAHYSRPWQDVSASLVIIPCLPMYIALHLSAQQRDVSELNGSRRIVVTMLDALFCTTSS